jgi:4-amino-4-deoxy-L-arabinose transferase-like glycosyltransferase
MTSIFGSPMNSTKRNFHKTWPWLVLAGLLAAGGFLRIHDLGNSSFWVDEVNTYYCAKSWNQSGKMVMPSGMVNERAPLYTVLTAAGLRVFGEDEAATRMPAALFGLVSIALGYCLAKRLFGRNIGLLTAFFLTFSPFEIGWSRTARMYTLLQMLTLLLVHAFVRGFETETIPVRDAAAASPPRKSPLQAVIAPLWLAVFGAVLMATFYGVHFLVLLLIPGLFLYMVGMAAVRWTAGLDRSRWLNKYSVTAAGGCLLAAALYAALPGVRSMVSYFLSYTPPWAAGGSSAQSRAVLFDFLISEQRFPLAALFFIGTLMTASRKSRMGWLIGCLFAVPVAMLTLVFSHRVPTYLFFVYPFFLMTAAFGFVRLVEGEAAFLQKDGRTNRRWMRGLFVAAALSVFILAPWMRIGLHIPFFGDGKTNLAVTFEEWREASGSVLSSRLPDDLVITSLPQVALYYGLRSDYCLNDAALEQSKTERFPRNADGRWVDMYAGAVCIESLDELRRLAGGSRGVWILVSQFHFNNAYHIPAAVRAFLTDQFDPPRKTRNGTVLVFHRSVCPEGRP